MTTNRWRRGLMVVASAGLCACASSAGVAPVVSASTGASSTSVSAAAAPSTSAASVAAPTTTSTLAVSPQGLAATLEQYRADQVTHLLQIQVNNRSGRDVRLAGLRPSAASMRPSFGLGRPQAIAR